MTSLLQYNVRVYKMRDYKSYTTVYPKN